jgi:hypothetical protein
MTVLGLLGCGQARDKSPRAVVDSANPVIDSVAVSAVVSELDSCSKEHRPTTRWSGAFRSFGRFTMFLPDSARMPNLDTVTGRLDVAWPRCADRCRFSVTVIGDSGVNLDARVARLVAEQRRIESVNRDPAKKGMEFDEIGAPPKPFNSRAGQGYVIDHACGDCAATTLKFGRPGQIADVSLSADAAPGAGVRMCEMAVVGKTFSWRP